MRLHLIILLGIFTLSSTLLVSCKKKKKGEVTMEFQLTNDEGNMALNSDFINDVGNRVVVEKLWLYFGNITFIKSDGEECLATEVELLQIDSD